MNKSQNLAGLRGISTGETAICSVGKHSNGLHYYGYDIAELARFTTFEEVAYLLTRGDLPGKSQLQAYVAKLKQNRSLPQTLKDMLETLPAHAHPMDIMRSGCSLLGVLEPELTFDQELDIADRLLAIMPSVLGYWYRFTQSGTRIDPSTDDDSIAAHLLHLFHGETPSDIQQRAMDVSLILYAEHEFNASTFTARVCASTLSDFYSAVCGAIGSLRGPLHGGANEAALALIERYQTRQEAVQGVKEQLRRKEKIMGFGHAVYKRSDPRNPLIKHWARQLARDTHQNRLYEVAEAIETVMKQEKQLFANLDFYSAVCYHCLGIPASLFTPIFVCSRMSGWAAHIIEQRHNNILIRPSANYIGPAHRCMIQIEQRTA